jgi:formylglycine-generating enzyme required for sulfatase activity
MGPTQRHFDAVRELCVSLTDTRAETVLLTSAFLNLHNAGVEDGLADVLAAAPPSARFLIAYGHANDDLPEQQERDMQSWLRALVHQQPSLAGRLLVVPSKRRSHEKVVVSSRGDWMVGSWNPGSSRPHATVFEGSLLGLDPRLAASLAERIEGNLDHPAALDLVGELRAQLADLPSRPADAGLAVERLQRAVALLASAVPESDGSCGEAWTSAILAARGALQPFITRIDAQLVDEQQTRDVLLALARSTQRDVLLASDRLANSALDAATLRDLRGDGRRRRTVRVVWGREWAGRQTTDRLAREQLERARHTVQEARELLGPALLTQEAPMENHAKMLIVDGRRGLVTSENLLSYGGEKGRYESRELGIAFWSPAIARHILGRMVLQWPDALSVPEQTTGGDLLAWCVAGSEAWHGLAAIANELDFEWRHPLFLENVVQSEFTDAQDEETEARRKAFASLAERLGAHPFAWVWQEGMRLGLLKPAETAWCPYDAETGDDVEASLQRATREVDEVTPHRPALARPVGSSKEDDPLVMRVLGDMIKVPAGVFWMGDDRVPEERPRHRVTISKPFLMGRTPVTQGLWEAVMGGLPHLRDVERHPDFPIIHVSYADMRSFVSRLNALTTGRDFDLPTEAQWEYACRGGSDSTYCFGDDPGVGDAPGTLERYAWTKRSSRARMHGVGELRPNAFGLCDMHGLVYETMRDGPRTYTRDAVTDPLGPRDGKNIVARGGFWGRFPVDPRRPSNEHFRCASRQIYEKSHRVSFRIVCDVGVDA